jgi:hypothetical protein
MVRPQGVDRNEEKIRPVPGVLVSWWWILIHHHHQNTKTPGITKNA